jgi:hypothetical protein
MATPKDSSTRAASSGARSSGSSSSATAMKATTSGVSLCARRGPGRARTGAGSPPSSSAAAAAYQLGRLNPKPAEATAGPSRWSRGVMQERRPRAAVTAG